VSHSGLLRVSIENSLRQRERRQPEDRAFERAGDGAGINHILRDVASLVDARQHEVRHRFAENVARAHNDAIGRRSSDGKVTRADFAQPQRVVQRQRVRHAGLVEFGRNHPDVVGQLLRDLLYNLEARRVDAVVVGA